MYKEVGIWVKAADEPLPKVDHMDTISIKFNGREQALIFDEVFDRWHWYGSNTIVNENHLNHIEWLKMVPLSTTEDLLKKAGIYAAEAEIKLGTDAHPKTASFRGFIAGFKAAVQLLSTEALNK